MLPLTGRSTHAQKTGIAMRPIPRLLGLTAVMLAASGCHTVGFYPVEVPPVAQPVQSSVGVQVSPEIASATYRFRSWMSGIANRWTVPYGPRSKEFAIKFLCAAFERCVESDGAGSKGSADTWVELTRVDYRVERHAAHMLIHARAIRGGSELLIDRDYQATGPSQMGAVFWGGVFAEKAIIRSSTDDALRQIFSALVEDLLAADRAPPGDP